MILITMVLILLVFYNTATSLPAINITIKAVQIRDKIKRVLRSLITDMSLPPPLTLNNIPI